MLRRGNPTRFMTALNGAENAATSGTGSSGDAIAAVSASLPAAFYTYDTLGNYPAIVKVDDTHALITYLEDSTTDCVATILELDAATGVLTEPGSVLTVDSANGQANDLAQMDDTHFINLYSGADNDAYAIILEVNTSTWAVTLPDSTFEVKDAITVPEQSAILKIDDTHAIAVYGDGGSLFARVLAVNTSTWAVTGAASETEITTDADSSSSLDMVEVDNNHFLVTWTDSANDGRAIALEVSLSTFAVTTGTEFQFDAADAAGPSVAQVDAAEHLVVYKDSSNLNAQVLNVNTSTLAVTETTAETSLGHPTITNNLGNWVRKITTTYFLVQTPTTYNSTQYTMWTVVFVDPSSYAISVLSNWIFKDFVTTGASSLGQMAVMSDGWMISVLANDTDGVAISIQTLY